MKSLIFLKSFLADFSEVMVVIRVEKLCRQVKMNMLFFLMVQKDSWLFDYISVCVWWVVQCVKFELELKFVVFVLFYYSSCLVEFINYWCDMFDFWNVGIEILIYIFLIMFEWQEDLVWVVFGCFDDKESGFIEKSCDMGVLWICCVILVWFWCFWFGIVVGWGFCKVEYVDKIGDLKFIFWKI